VISYLLGEPIKTITLNLFSVIGNPLCVTTLGSIHYILENRLTIYDSSIINVNALYNPDSLSLVIDSVDSSKCITYEIYLTGTSSL
jgi:hypothetical protein